ncbi:PQQ-binding-like beta-propeller repeat protein [Haloplanus pelagicus]|jgi:outer membrane protein assembly factor BamB|uniref:outer membrane protein assembly factor BamB family protein n=1 Tax=Haloplanus pelagicus TaxID=2949995 RepID=UPI0020413C74|nr:PQQ-binding-like beta-propeller repeat protein [Haloplanus sp. HW8-1]
MPSIERRTFLGTVAAGVVAGLGGCSSSCPDSDPPEPATTLGTGEADRGFDTLPGGSWPTPRFDTANTGFAPSRRPPTTAPALRWRTTLPAPPVDDATTDVSPPTVAGDRVFVTTGEGAFGLSLREGRERWRYGDLSPATVDSAGSYGRSLAPPVLNGDTAYVPAADGVVALRVDDGTERWRTTDVTPTGTPVVADGVVFVPTGDELVALDVAAGRRRWAAATSGGSLPAVTGGVVVVAGEELLGLDAATGDRLWSSSVGPESHPVVADGTVHLGTYEGVVGVDLDDGTERWTVDRGGGRTYSTPVVTPETVYAVERPGEAGDATFALDRTEGSPDPRWCSYVGEGAVTAAASGHAFALQSGPGEDRKPPRLLAFTERFGEAAWGYRSAEPLVSPALLDGGVVTATRRGTVVAVGGE